MEFKPVNQQRRNDCLSACVASILGIPLGNVPVWMDQPEESRREDVLQFIRGYNLGLLIVAPDDNNKAEIILAQDKDLYCIVIKRNPSRPDIPPHAYVYKGDTVAHDPAAGYAGNDGHTEIFQIWILYVTEPWKHANKQRA